jgi:hypothetical protein
MAINVAADRVGDGQRDIVIPAGARDGRGQLSFVLLIITAPLEAFNIHDPI